jgi:excisionase family DNA binding protein
MKLEERQLLSVSETAEQLSNSPQWICFLAREGHLPFIETKLGRLFRRADVHEFAERRERQSERGRLKAAA